MQQLAVQRKLQRAPGLAACSGASCTASNAPALGLRRKNLLRSSFGVKLKPTLGAAAADTTSSMVFIFGGGGLMGGGSSSLGMAASQSCAACCTCASVGSRTGVHAQNDVLRTPRSSMRVSRGVAAAKRPHGWWPHGSTRAPGSLEMRLWARSAVTLFRSTTARLECHVMDKAV